MIIERFNYSDTETEGLWWLDDDDPLHTIERPWIPNAVAPGGAGFISCIPDGVYQLIRHARPNGDVVLALRNPKLGVYYSRENVPDIGGRYLILAHVGNYVDDVQGCIAPGASRTIAGNRRMVGNSRSAMARIMAHYRRRKPKTLTIRSVLGAAD